MHSNVENLFTQKELDSLFGSSWSPSDAAGDLRISGVSTDSRSVKPDQIFVCLKGESFDAHDFADQAAEKGASVILAESSRRADVEKRLTSFEAVRVYFVPDALEALCRLAELRRSQLRAPVLGVAGSNGKTSTKDMLYSGASAVLEGVYATAGNLNNHIGLPLTLANIPADAKLVILEMGMNHPGELSALSKIARPDHAIVTSIAEEHAEFFSSIEEIALAELEITDGMPPGGTLLFHSGSAGGESARRKAGERGLNLRFFSADEVRLSLDGISFACDRLRIENPNYLSAVMAENLTGALLLLSAAGLSEEQLVTAGRSAHPAARRRFEPYRREAGDRRILLIDDSYNANQASFEAGIASLRAILPSGRLALFAGEMAELGRKSADAHRAVGLAAAAAQMDLYVSGTGDAGILAAAFTGARPGARIVRAEKPLELLQGFSADHYDGILVKGSRRAKMDLVSDAIINTGFTGRSYV